MQRVCHSNWLYHFCECEKHWFSFNSSCFYSPSHQQLMGIWGICQSQEWGIRRLYYLDCWALILPTPGIRQAFAVTIVKTAVVLNQRVCVWGGLKRWAFSSKTLLKVDQNENAYILCWSGRSKTHQNENGDRKGACVCSMRIEFHLRHNV